MSFYRNWIEGKMSSPKFCGGTSNAEDYDYDYHHMIMMMKNVNFEKLFPLKTAIHEI